MELVFNKDGSIKLKKIDESIQQGNVGVNKVDVAIEGYSPEDYTLTFNFLLPNGQVTTLVGTQTVTITYDNDTYQGKRVTLGESQTYYAGRLKMNVIATDSSDNKLFTYSIALTINPTAYIPSVANITGEQYANLISVLNTKQDKFVFSNARYYHSLAEAQLDQENLAYGQIAIVVNDKVLTYYTKTGAYGTLVRVFAENDMVTVPASTDSGTFTEDEYNRLLESHETVIYKEPNEIFRLNDRTLDNDELVYSHVGYRCEGLAYEGFVKQILIDTTTREWQEQIFILPSIAWFGNTPIPTFHDLYISNKLTVEYDCLLGDTTATSLELEEDGTLGENLKAEIRKLINE